MRQWGIGGTVHTNYIQYLKMTLKTDFVANKFLHSFASIDYEFLL